MRYGVVIPTFNEASFIGETIASLSNQEHPSGEAWDIEVVVADTPGEDGTADIVRTIGETIASVKVTVLSENEGSMVAARKRGFDYLLSRPEGSPDVLISVDADTSFPPTWFASIDQLIAQGHRMISTSGCFEHSFWLRCKALSRRYAEHIGTLFFNRETMSAVVGPGETPLFTSRLFHRFGRPLSDCGFAVTADLYRALGGICREYYDDACRHEIPAVGWPLMFRTEFADVPIAFMAEPEYETSARRLLHEPEALFSGSSYLREIENFRTATNDQYAWLDHFAPRLDMEPLRRYVVKNYILQQCITRPERVIHNAEYFGDAANELHADIKRWRDAHPDPPARDVFHFADVLADNYWELILHRARILGGAFGRPPRGSL